MKRSIRSTDGASAIPTRCICSWCRSSMRRGAPGAGTNYGICPACLQKELSANGIAPVAAVDLADRRERRPR